MSTDEFDKSLEVESGNFDQFGLLKFNTSSPSGKGKNDIKFKLSEGNLICPMEPNVTFLQSLYDRSSWLIGLLIFQSCSSYILAANIELLERHPSIIYFLTMLVGAGGNCGNQSSVRIIRGIAMGTITEKNQMKVLKREGCMAVSICIIMSVVGLLRCHLSSTTFEETIAITASLVIIVFISIIMGAILPLLLQKLGTDSVHASTSIQVIMDISGVLITCIVSSIILNKMIPTNTIIND
jgi:Mg/Co/Ni transporter MgtE